MAGASGLAARFRLGWLVFIALVVLTVVEYALVLLIPGGAPLLILLLVFQLTDAGLILWYFMHMSQLWRSEQH